MSSQKQLRQIGYVLKKQFNAWISQPLEEDYPKSYTTSSKQPVRYVFQQQLSNYRQQNSSCDLSVQHIRTRVALRKRLAY